MAEQEVGNLAVRLSLDSANFEQSMSSINRNLKALGQEMRGNQNLGRDWGNSIAGLTTRQDTLTRTLDAQDIKVRRLREAYDASVAATGENSVATENLAIQLNRAQAELNRTETELGQVSSALQQQQAALTLSENRWTQLGERMREVGATMQNVGKEMTKIGKEMSMKVTAPIVAVGVASLKLAADFEAQMSRVGAIAGATGDEMNALKKSAMSLGADTSKSASEVAIAMEDMAAMGFTAIEIIGAMPGVISASEASGESLALSAQTVAAALNIWGLEATEAGRVADVLAMAANASAAGIGDMQLAFKYAGAPAAALGIEMEDVAAAIGIMTDAGLDGSNAGTALRSSLLALNNPAKAQAKIMDKLGISMRDENNEAISLSEMIGTVADQTAHMTEADKVATVAKLVGTEAVSGFLSLMKAGPAEIDKMSDALRNSAGESARTAAVMKDNLKGALEELGGTLETAAIQIGNILIPIVRDMAKAVQSVVDKFTELSPATQETILKIAGVAAAIGPLLVIGGALASSIGAILTAFGTVSSAIAVMTTGVASAVPAVSALAGVFTVLTGPIGWAIAAIVAVGAAVVVAYKKIDWFRDGIDKIWIKIKESTSAAFAFVKEIVVNVISEIVSFGEEILGKFSGFWESNGKSISESVKYYFGLVKKEIDRIMRSIQGVFEIVWPIVSGVVKTAWASIKTIVLSAIDIITGVIQSFTKLLEGDWKGAWESIVGIAENIMKNIISNFKSIDLEQIGRDMIQGFIDGIVTMMGTTRDELSNQFEHMKGVISEKLSNIKESIVTRLDEWKTSITDWFTSVPGVISEQLAEWENTITTWFKNMPNVIITQLIEWGNAIKNWTIEQNEENIRQFAEWGVAIADWFNSIPAMLTGKLAEWTVSISSWFIETKDNIIKKLADWVAAIATWFVDTKNEIITWFADWTVTITTWFSDTRDTIITKLADWLSSISIWFKEMPSNIGTWLTEWWTKISTWFSEIPARITVKFEEWWQAIKAWFASVPEKPEIKNMGKNMIDKVAAGNKEKQSEFIDKLGKIMVDVALGALAVAGVALIAAGREIIKRLIDGVQAMKSGLDTKMKEIGDGIVSKIKSIDLFQVGKDIILGLVNGIGSMASAVWDKAKDIANGIAKTISNALQVKSPSRLMMAIGRYTGQGLAIGIEGTKSDNEKAIDGVAKVIVNSAKKNAEDVSKIASDAEKKRTEIQSDFAKKRAELERKTDQSSQNALKTSKNKKGQIVTTGSKKVQDIRANASAALIKLNDDEQKKLTAVNTKAWADMQKKEAEISKAKLESIKTFIADKKSLDELSAVDESEILRQSMELFESGTKERVEIQKAYQSALKTINDDVLKVNEEYTGKMQKINDDLRKQEDDLTKEYEKSLSNRAMALFNFAGTFDHFEVKIEKSGQDLMNNLTGQIQGFKRWQQEIEELSAKAIDEGLISELKGMGPKALPELIALNSLSSTEMQKYSDMYKEKSRLAREQAEKEMAPMKANTEKQIADLRAVANKELTLLESEWTNKMKAVTKTTDDELMSLKSIGRNAAQGLLNGLASMEGSLVNKARDIANSVSKAMEKALQVKSPSRVTMRIGKFVGEGLEKGMDNSIANIERSARGMANAAVPDIAVAGMGGYGSQGGQSVSSTNNYSTPINVVLNYSGDASVQNMMQMVDIVERELGSRMNSQMRMIGVKG